MQDLDFFLGLEHRVWQALCSGDMAADRALLAADFLGVYATGFSDRAGHVGQLCHGPSVARYTIRDARLKPLAEKVFLLAYRADFTRIGRSQSEAMFVSSIWEARAGGWRNSFSQDSCAADPAPL